MAGKHEVRCPICFARFASKEEMEQHNRARHTQQGLSGMSPSGDYDSEPDSDDRRRD